MEALLKQRKVVKAKITRAHSYWVNAAVAVDHNLQELFTRLELLDAAWEEYNNVSMSIITAGSEDEMAAQEQDQEEVENKYINTRSGLKQIIASVHESPQGTQGANLIDSGAAKPDIKLPRMDLPTFSGDYVMWTTFKDLFTSIVHNNKQISNAQKLHYLKNALKGEASVLLHSMDTTDANYEEAWRLLTDRYQNERQIISSHIHHIFTQEPMTNESYTDLRKLLDNTTKHVRALKVLGVPVEQWDHVLVFILCERMNKDTRKQWELSLAPTGCPTFAQIHAFLDQRCRALESASAVQKPVKSIVQHRNQFNTVKVHSAVTMQCPICGDNHFIYQCGKFLEMRVQQRESAVKSNSLCFNCLRAGHTSRGCKSKHNCRRCGKHHNTLLHHGEDATTVACATDEHSSVVSNHVVSNHPASQVLLATMRVEVRDAWGKKHQVRALLDGASEGTLITEALAQSLGYPRRRTRTQVVGLGELSSGTARGEMHLSVVSCVEAFELSINALIVNKISGLLPHRVVARTEWKGLSQLHLADPMFWKPDRVDILIGADYYYDVIKMEMNKVTDGVYTQGTHFGWIISGRVPESSPHVCVHLLTTDTDELKQFWELEEVAPQHFLTSEEQKCEEHFVQTHRRNKEGRYVVSLPLRDDPPPIGESREQAIRRFRSLERRLKTSEHRNQYIDFLKEYKDLGHMSQVGNDDPAVSYYLPHHFVLKEDSTTTKLRVVFDASAKTTTGLSLNDSLMVGGRLQPDIFDILLRFRTHRYALTADIKMMYRQVLVQENHRDLQRIVWRDGPEQPWATYQLNTVTYGMASSPFLATRVLQQLAREEESNYSAASAVILTDFYVDDVMTGAETLEAAGELQQDLCRVLRKGGLELRKWSASDPVIVNMIPAELRQPNAVTSITSDGSIKTLGLRWNPGSDSFVVRVSVSSGEQPTKRRILSEIARIFDPLGWVTPVVIRAKVLIQGLWLSGSGWDDPVSAPIERDWTHLKHDLARLNQLQIPRFIVDRRMNLQLHGFCDASQAAYGAVIYVRLQDEEDHVTTHLLCSKSKVAPIKQVSIPRLELCGAVLLSRLLHRVQGCIGVPIASTHTWTDSTVVLAWIKDHPGRWKTFIANRVAEIQSLIEPQYWGHVPTTENPADLASRGVKAEELHKSELWWSGPQFLRETTDKWPSLPHQQQVGCDEERKRTLIVTVGSDIIIDKFSQLGTLQRVTAYCNRFIFNCKVGAGPRKTGELSLAELRGAMVLLVKLAQAQSFASLIQQLRKAHAHKHELLGLAPFLDSHEVIRVGGRLRQSSLTTDQKHPILLPKRHRLTRLIVEDYHYKLLHPGSQMLLATIRQKFWIINGRSSVRFYTHSCRTCFRERARPMQQQMGELPQHRLEVTRPFFATGLDYGGPFFIKAAKGRGQKRWKAYMALFVCMATKAVHLELVSDLTTDAFIAALRRFVSRRGKPQRILSDNATNFVGASRELRTLLGFVAEEQHQQQLRHECKEQEISWQFIPARAPHFGGVWEAGIKAVKMHLKRVVGETVLTFEELTTLLTQIEACLNSRPLCALSSDPNDLSALTPGHFLIGSSLVSAPDPSVEHTSMNRLSRWQLVQRLSQSVWRRWRHEYVSQLQQRPKWKAKRENVAANDLVIIREDNVAPQRWMLGRVVTTYPGQDKLVRVVSVKTKNGVVKRPITKLCLLPMPAES